ncbi:diguanylate cyclase [Aquabacterium sp. NJ1]|uniref:GGDEF domain-containing protein n=1 Tax=Aquabacterium sp. NJ1 TaxID=1538295 RepID=UPI0006910E83|nr:diguanylate cyclase [Aquabacterium sp. NJ1]
MCKKHSHGIGMINLASWTPLAPPAPSPQGQDAAEPMSASTFEIVQQQGFPQLRFPPSVEAHFQADKAPERMAQMRTGAGMSILLTSILLVPDWIMVPDRFLAALTLRLLVFVPLLMLGVSLLPLIRPAWREWVGALRGVLGAGIIVYLCMSSTDELAAPYLVSLSLIPLFNGGLERLRFWPALLIDLIVLALFAFAALSIPHANFAVMVGTALVMVSTILFTLYGSYWLEYEERTNWLMLQHEHLLLDKLEAGNKRLDQLTRFDPLTEIANRRHFDEFLAQVWARARQDGQEVALLMIDIDHFKLYNDHYGHPVGDACLKEVAATMSRHLRKPGDLVARFGGEEFIAVLSRTSLPEAMAAAERVREAVWRLQRPHEASPVQPWVTVSIGVACLRANAEQASVPALLAQADEALYKAKSMGRNQACTLQEAGHT